MKKLAFIQRSDDWHWVGDGFPVRAPFSYTDRPDDLSPFLRLAHAGPAEFTPTDKRRGVGEHPHRGIETVTIVYSGEVEHRDLAGGGGIIGPGDVQWMTAAGGVVHEEFHGPEFTRRGGKFEMIQLWVNLPAREKMSRPRYQEIRGADIPVVNLPAGAGKVRVIAGEHAGERGPASTFSPINLWDLLLEKGRSASLSIPEGQTTSIFVRNGRVRIAGVEAREADVVVLERQGSDFEVEAIEGAEMLVMTGDPLNEPVVGYGPFVMNTPAEIRHAIADYQSGRMGALSAR